MLFFFFKQKTAYECRISDWSSDVCSSDLYGLAEVVADLLAAGAGNDLIRLVFQRIVALHLGDDRLLQRRRAADRRVLGRAALDRVDRRILDVLRRIEIRLTRG